MDICIARFDCSTWLVETFIKIGIADLRTLLAIRSMCGSVRLLGRGVFFAIDPSQHRAINVGPESV